MKEFIIKKCQKCGAIVEVLQDCTCENCGIKCCGEEMKKIEPNSSKGDPKNHIPQYEIAKDTILVKVNHVVEENNHIEWIAMCSDEVIGKKFLKPNENPSVAFPYIPGSTIYAYCKEHGLWKNEVK